MRGTLLALLLAALGGCATKDIEIVAGGPADTGAAEAPRAPGLAPLSSDFDPELAAPSASPASSGDPHQHHHHHGHGPAAPPKSPEAPAAPAGDEHQGHDHRAPQ